MSLPKSTLGHSNNWETMLFLAVFRNVISGFHWLVLGNSQEHPVCEGSWDEDWTGDDLVFPLEGFLFKQPHHPFIIPSQDDRVRLIQKPESLNRQGRRGYVVLNPEEAAKLWVPDVIIDKVIIANTIIIESKILWCMKTPSFGCAGDPDPCSEIHRGGRLRQALPGRHHQVGLNRITMTDLLQKMTDSEIH